MIFEINIITDENRLEAIKAKDVDIGLPANNKQQEKAILISLRSTFSLIHGPPGKVCNFTIGGYYVRLTNRT